MLAPGAKPNHPSYTKEQLFQSTSISSLSLALSTTASQSNMPSTELDRTESADSPKLELPEDDSWDDWNNASEARTDSVKASASLVTEEELAGTISGSPLGPDVVNGSDSVRMIVISDVQDTIPERSRLDARSPQPGSLCLLLEDWYANEGIKKAPPCAVT